MTQNPRKVLTGLDLNGTLTVNGSGGTNGYFLKTDGSGNVSWSAVSAGSGSANNYAQTVGTKTSVLTSYTFPYTVISITITTSGNPVFITVTGDAENATASTWGRMQLYRGSTAIGNDIQFESSAASENVPYSIHYIDTPSAGTYTYSMKIVLLAGGNWNFGENTGPVMTAVELSSVTPSTAITLNGSAPQISLTNGTANQIKMSSNGLGAPTFTSYSSGAKLITFDNITGSSTGHAIGTESGYMWFGVSDTTNGFKWYGGTTNLASLSGAGLLTASNLSASTITSTVGPGTAPFVVASTTTVANLTANAVGQNLTIGTTGLTTTSGSSPWNGSAAATIDIDTTKVPQLTTNTNIFAAASGATTLVVKQGATQSTTDLLQIQNTSATVLSGISPIGQIYAGSTGVLTAVNSVTGSSQISLTSAAYTSATVATFTYNLTTQVVAVGQKVYVVGVTGGTYNGTWLVTATGGTSGAYTFTVQGSGFTSPAGTGGAASLSATASFTGSSIATTPLVIQALSSQTANLQEWQTSNGNIAARIASNGSFSASGLTVLTGYNLSLTGTTTPLSVNGSVGTAGQVLTSGGASTTPSWSNVGYTLIASSAFSTAPSFSSIPQTFKKLVAVITFTNIGTFSTSLTYNFNATNTGYSRIIPGTGTSFTTSAGAAAVLSTVTPVAGQAYVVTVDNYTNAKAIGYSFGDCYTLTAPIAAAVTSMAFAASTSWGGATGTAYLYGVN